MKKIIFIILSLFLYTNINAQVKCFQDPITWNVSMSVENYMQGRHNRISQFPGFGSVDVVGSIEYKNFTYSAGVGYAWDEEIIGYDTKEFTTWNLVNTLYVDSTYWINGRKYIYHEEIKIYDSVSVIKPILINSKYQYFKIPVSITYKVYNYWDIDIYAKFKGNMFYELTRKIEIRGSDDEPEDYTWVLEPRKKKFYSIFGLGTEVSWHIVNYRNNSTIKSTSMIKKITIFIGLMYYYQPVKFQTIYKPTYMSFTFGVRVFSF